MSHRWLTVLVAASLALNIAVVAGFFLLRPRPCQAPVPGMNPRERREVMKMRRQFDPKMDSLRETLRAKRGELYRLAADSASPAEADSLLQAIGDIRVEMNRLAYEHMRVLMAKLSPKQREEFLRRLQSGPQSWHSGSRGPGRGCPPPQPPDFDDR